MKYRQRKKNIRNGRIDFLVREASKHNLLVINSPRVLPNNIEGEKMLRLLPHVAWDGISVIPDTGSVEKHQSTSFEMEGHITW